MESWNGEFYWICPSTIGAKLEEYIKSFNVLEIMEKSGGFLSIIIIESITSPKKLPLLYGCLM